MGKDERTLQMERECVELHNQGLMPKEIAQKFNLSRRTVYNSLQKIADEAGVSRQSLLEIPHKEHAKYDVEKKNDVPVKIEELNKKIDKVIAGLNELLDEVNFTIMEMEELERSEKENVDE